MDKEKVIEALARCFRIDVNEDTNTYDINDYEFESGCSFNGRWLCIKNVIEALEKADLIY